MAAQLAASQEGLSSVSKKVNKLDYFIRVALEWLKGVEITVLITGAQQLF
jgi:hypothetical protein